MVFFVLFAALFLGFHVFLASGLVAEGLRHLRRNLGRKLGSEGLPAVSVIIPARDESVRIGPLLESLVGQEYPNFEVVFVEDRSRDDTAELLERYVALFPGGRARLLTLSENPGPNFKQYALARGIDAARGEVFLFTDADCEFSPSWIASMVEPLRDGRTGLVIGPVFRRRTGKGVFDSFQAFDHAVRFMYLAGGVGLGIPCGGFGNNLCVTRTAVDAIGGYGAVPFSLTEDAALIAEIRKRTSFRVRAVFDADSRVMTASESSWKDLIRQGLRWNNGGLYSPDATTRVGFAALMFSIAFGVITLPLAPFFPVVGLAGGAVYLSMVLNTASTFLLARGTLGSSPLAGFRNLLLTPAYFAFLTILGVLRVRVIWKGERVS